MERAEARAFEMALVARLFPERYDEVDAIEDLDELRRRVLELTASDS